MTAEPHAMLFGDRLPPQGVQVRVQFGANGFELHERSGTVHRVAYDHMEIKRGGWRGDALLLEWSDAGNARSLTLGRDEGMTKLLFDKQTHRVIGAGIVGTNAGDLIAEAALAIEMGADAADIGLTVHPHPTLSETIAFAAEAFEGTLTDLYLPKRK